MSSYANISEIGSGEIANRRDIFSYCAVPNLMSGFLHGSIAGSSNLLAVDSLACQRGLAESCAENYSSLCRQMTTNPDKNYVNGITENSVYYPNPSKGDILLRNIAAEKYLVSMSKNCVKMYQPFDPTVAKSPLISNWIPHKTGCSYMTSTEPKKGVQGLNPSVCLPEYGVNPETIDSDPVMNDILLRPWCAMDILINIYNYSLRNGTLEKLKGTKLYVMFMKPEFQKLVKNKN